MQLFSFPYHFTSLPMRLLAFQVCKAFKCSTDTANVTQGCPVFCTGGQSHRRITDFHSTCHVISISSNKISLFKILQASPFAIVLNKLKSLQIHQLLPFINSEMNWAIIMAFGLLSADGCLEEDPSWTPYCNQQNCHWLGWGRPCLLQTSCLHGITLSLEAWCQGL